MNLSQVAKKLEEASRLLRSSASAFRHGRYNTAMRTWDRAEDALMEAKALWSASDTTHEALG